MKKINKTNEKANKMSKDTIIKINKNLSLMILILVYIILLIIGNQKIEETDLKLFMQVFSGIFLFFGIIGLERAYKKDSGEITITALELILVSIFSLTINHIVIMYSFDYNIYVLSSFIIISIYYIIKLITIYTNDRKNCLNTFNDIAEITKKEEPRKKEAKKRNVKKEEIILIEVKEETKKENTNQKDKINNIKITGKDKNKIKDEQKSTKPQKTKENNNVKKDKNFKTENTEEKDKTTLKDKEKSTKPKKEIKKVEKNVEKNVKKNVEKKVEEDIQKSKNKNKEKEKNSKEDINKVVKKRKKKILES